MIVIRIQDKELGDIYVRKNPRAKRYILRVVNQQVVATMPQGGSQSELLDFIAQNKEYLKERLQTQQTKPTPQDLSQEEFMALYRAAADYLPKRLSVLSVEHQLPYRQVKLRDLRSRWGSCSSQKNISLSIHLMRLPKHLIDYVLLHELCHTKEMNHGAGFWALMDKVCGQSAKALRKELRTFF